MPARWWPCSTDRTRTREVFAPCSPPMDLADATLVAVAEREMIRAIFTLDGRDFGVYRPARIGRFSVIP